MPAPTLQFKRGLVANLPGLKAGEPGFTTDFFELYVGIDSTTNNNKFLGSHRYWSKGSTSTGSGVNLVEGTSNGSDFITLKAPDTLAGIVTYTFPAAPINNNVLTTNANGVLSWTSVITELTVNSFISGIGTFTNNVAFTTTTDNTLGNENTGGVQLDGGMGIAKNLTVKQNLSVGGFVEIVGAGVTINAGGINVAAGIVTASRFVSNVLTGTAPISVASSTRVDNLNAQYIGGFAAPTSQVIGSSDTQTLTNKSIALGSNTITGTLAEFNTALTDADFVSIAGTETLTNKTLTSPILTTPSLGIATATSINVSGIVTATSFSGNVTGTATTTTNIPNLTGAITSVNTTTSLGSFSSSNLATALTDETGSGSAVFSTSPTLVTPVLGAATATSVVVGSGVTINASGINAAAGIITASSFVGSLTGTASTTTNIPNLTGAITSVNTTTSLGSFSSANLATALTDETGSGVAVFATSPTLVTPALGDATATTIVTSGAVNVGTALSAPTVKTATIQHSNATNAATIDASGNITAAQNLTISGNLFVNGSTTQVNTAAITVEDRTIELGVVDGAAPTSATTWDLGVLFNYHASTAKKSAVIWEQGDARFKFASVLAADSDGSNVNTPQLTVTTFAPIEIASLFVNDCAGASQVISCTGSTRFLENITVDAGSF